MKKLLLSSLLATLLATLLSATTALAADDWTPFWTKFKAAIAKNNVEAIADMTKFPYYLYGDPLNRKQFIKKCSQLFDAKSRKALLKEKPVLDKADYMVFVDDSIYIFSKVNGKYMFTEMGVND